MIMVSLNRIFNTPLLRQSFVYVVCDGINKAIPFLLLPFITYYLSPDDYGIITNFNVYVQIVSVFGYLCTAGALPVMFYKLKKEEVRSYVSNMVLLNTLVTIVCIIINLAVYKPIAKGLNINLIFQLYAIVFVWFSGITNVNMILWRCEEKPVAFGVYQISQSAVNAVTTILFVITLLMGWQGRIYSSLLSAGVFGFVSIVILYRRGYLEARICKDFILQTTLFAIPIIPHALSFWFRGGVEKILLSNMYSLSENGLYSVALTWGAIVTMFLTAFSNAYSPYLYKKLAKFDKDRDGTLGEQIKLIRLIKLSILAIGVFVVIAYLVSLILIKAIYPSDYFGCLVFLPWVMLSQLFQGCYLMFVGFPHYTFKTKPLGIITFTWSLISCGFAWIGIKLMGPVGVAVASAFVSFATFISIAILSTKVYQLPWKGLLSLKL